MDKVSIEPTKEIRKLVAIVAGVSFVVCFVATGAIMTYLRW